MIVAMMVLMVVTLLIGAAFVAANGDVATSKHDTDGKRAYYAARAGLSASSSSSTRTPSSGRPARRRRRRRFRARAGATYAYTPVLAASGPGACTTANPVGTFIDIATGTFRMKFTGTAGHSGGLAHDHRPVSPPEPARLPLLLEVRDARPEHLLRPGQLSGLRRVHPPRSRPSSAAYIQWVSGDTINGPLYTQDQYYICGSPTFGRAGTNDVMASAAPVDTNDSVGHGAVIKGCSGQPDLQRRPGQPARPMRGTIDPPSDNTNLLPYAQNYGKIYTGKTDDHDQRRHRLDQNASVAAAPRRP